MIRKKTFLLFIVMFFMGLTIMKGNSVVAYHVVGKVTYMTSDGSSKLLVMNTILTKQTKVSIPYGGKLELIDEKSKQRITISTPGSGTIAQLMTAKGNSAKDISERYIAYVKKQLTNKGLTSQQRYSDFATVTRQLDSVEAARQPSQNALVARFGKFKKQTFQKFRNFRAECNAKYTEAVRKAWQSMGSEPAIEKPVEPKVAPVVMEDTARTARFLFFGRKKKKANLEENAAKADSAVRIQANPVEPVQEVDVPSAEKQYAEMPFYFLGNELTVRLDETKRLHLGKLSPNRVADALKYLGTETYDNLLYDCLKLRKEHHLCDWAYLLMLTEITDQFCGPGTNESQLLLGWLFYQSGYKVRFAMANKRLYLLVASDYLIYGKPYYTIDGVAYYPLENVQGDIDICKASFPKETRLSLRIWEQMVLDKQESGVRTIKSADYPGFDISVSVDENLMAFYNNYPSSCENKDNMTRWVLYAETPLADEVKNQIYPQLKSQLEGMSEIDAVSHLLNLVQTGLEYEYDENVWGGDRAFFAEESLYYPYCDCEDRSILFTRLVRDLLGMDCVLIYYPGHLASAVHFNSEVPGDYYEKDGKAYTVCDPTYIHADVGMQMPSFANTTATLIPLKTKD